MKQIKIIVKWIKKFKIQKIVVSDHRKRNDDKILYSSPKLIASSSVIDEVFKSMHQSIATNIKSMLLKTGLF